MSREIEKISNMIGYPVIIETEEKKAFDLALWKILNCDIGYYFNVIYLLLTSRRRREFIKMLREQEKQAFELACWRILNGKKKFYFNIVLLFLFGKKRKNSFLNTKRQKRN